LFKFKTGALEIIENYVGMDLEKLIDYGLMDEFCRILEIANEDKIDNEDKFNNEDMIILDLEIFEKIFIFLKETKREEQIHIHFVEKFREYDTLSVLHSLQQSSNEIICQLAISAIVKLRIYFFEPIKRQKKYLPS